MYLKNLLRAVCPAASIYKTSYRNVSRFNFPLYNLQYQSTGQNNLDVKFRKQK